VGCSIKLVNQRDGTGVRYAIWCMLPKACPLKTSCQEAARLTSCCRAAMSTTLAAFDLTDLDPNNLLYRPRGERGEGGGKAPIGANVAAVQAGARIDWGHLKGVLCRALTRNIDRSQKAIVSMYCSEQCTWHGTCWMHTAA
jgi:hypothetical protein